MKKVAILQSNYIPWKGYFDLVSYVDEFIIYDDMQYTKRDWRNRNQIKTPSGLQWLTVPVLVRGNYHQKIRDAKIEPGKWRSDHWKAFEQNYRRASHFGEIECLLRPEYEREDEDHLSGLNRRLIEVVCAYLGIGTRLTDSSDYELVEGKSERLAELCLQAQADCYVSGPAAKTYIDVAEFEKRGIEVEWFDYGGYREYPQLWGDFVHTVSIVDLLFNCGPTSVDYLKFAR